MSKIINLIFAPIKWVLRFLLKCALILALVVIILLACGNFWLPRVTTWQLRSLTGFSTDIRSSRGSLFKGYVDFRDVAIKNPSPQFEEQNFVTFNNLGVDVDLTSVFKDTIVLESVVIDIDSITIVKNADGIHNYSVFIDNIKNAVSDKDSTKEKSSDFKKDAKKAEKPAKNISINKLVLAIKSVRTIDEKTGNVKEYSLKYRREFSNITDPSSLIAPLTADLGAYGLSALIQSTISSIGDLPGINQVKSGISKVKDVSTDAVKGIGSGIKGIFSK